MRFFPALVSTLLIPLVTFAPAMAQVPDAAPALQVRVIDSNAPDQLAVQVSDAAGSRVPNATVVFRLPEGATAPDGGATATAQTDGNGVAQIAGIHWNMQGGTVRITATKGTAHAGVLFEKQAAPAQPSPMAQQPSPAPKPQYQPEAIDIQRPVPAEKPAPARQPGVVVENDDSPNANVPIRPWVAEAAGGLTPRMSIVSNGKGASSDHHLRNRLLIGLAVAAAGGAAFALTHNMGSSGSSSSSGVSVGPPSVSVGHP